MILDIENPKDATIKLLELINKLVKLQDTKLIYRNLLHFYTLTMKEKLNNPIYQHIQQNKIPRNKPTKGGKRPVLQKQ